MANPDFGATILQAIEGAVHDRIQEEVDKQIATATKAIEDALKGEIDKIALQISQHYSLSTGRDSLLIEVKKPEPRQ